MAASGSRGGPQTPGLASCIAPYPIRCKVSAVPGRVKDPPRFEGLGALSVWVSFMSIWNYSTINRKDKRPLRLPWPSGARRARGLPPE
jgi:hypothetical protein